MAKTKSNQETKVVRTVTLDERFWGEVLDGTVSEADYAQLHSEMLAMLQGLRIPTVTVWSLKNPQQSYRLPTAIDGTPVRVPDWVDSIDTHKLCVYYRHPTFAGKSICCESVTVDQIEKTWFPWEHYSIDFDDFGRLADLGVDIHQKMFAQGLFQLDLSNMRVMADGSSKLATAYVACGPDKLPALRLGLSIPKSALQYVPNQFYWTEWKCEDLYVTTTGPEAVIRALEPAFSVQSAGVASLTFRETLSAALSGQLLDASGNALSFTAFCDCYFGVHDVEPSADFLQLEYLESSVAVGVYCKHSLSFKPLLGEVARCMLNVKGEVTYVEFCFSDSVKLSASKRMWKGAILHNEADLELELRVDRDKLVSKLVAEGWDIKMSEEEK